LNLNVSSQYLAFQNLLNEKRLPGGELFINKTWVKLIMREMCVPRSSSLKKQLPRHKKKHLPGDSSHALFGMVKNVTFSEVVVSDLQPSGIKLGHSG